MANYLGVDYGEKRIGLAIANGSPRIARPLQTLNNDDHTAGALASIIADYDISEVVWGLPRGLDGQDTRQTAEAKAAALRLLPELPCHFQDEAVTSELAVSRGANRVVDFRDVHKVSSARHKRALKAHYSAKKGEIDAEAAAIILQDYLDTI